MALTHSSEAVSRFVDLGGPTFYVEYPGPEDHPPMVLVHGLGGSHVNWDAIAPLLARRRRVLVPDLAGHGLTRPDHRSTDVDSNQRLLDRFIDQVAGRRVVLVGNSMGGMIGILQAARRPDTVAALALVSPAVPIPVGLSVDPTVAGMFLVYTMPFAGKRLVALRRRMETPKQQVEQLLELCCVDPRRVPRETIDRSILLAAQRRSFHGVEEAFTNAARSVIKRNLSRPSYHRHLRAVRSPVLLLHGEADRLVPLRAAQEVTRALPHWRFVPMPGIGHVAMLEDAQTTAAEIEAWLDQL